MNVVPFKQSTYDSCLPVCLLMYLKTVKNINFSKEDELDLLIKGISLVPRAYYPGIILEFVKKYGLKLNLHIDNKYMFKTVRNILKHKNIVLTQKRIELNHNSPCIIYIDNYLLGDSIHSPHFVLIEKRIKNRFVIVDPWKGKKFYIKEEKLINAIESLKLHLKFCPILITFN